MINSLFFSNRYLLEFPFEGDRTKFCDSLYPSIFSLKDDPYWGIDDDIRKKISSKYLCYREEEKIFFYNSRAFLEADYTGKPIYPYFKGEIEQQKKQILIKGSLKYNKLFNLLFPVILVSVILLGILLHLSLFYLLVLPLFFIILKISGKNLEKEMIEDLEIICEVKNV